MDFIKQMKKREFIEMGLKTLAAVLAVFLAIILMAGMIYSIQLHSLKKNAGEYTATGSTTIAYCIEQKNDQYLVLFYNEDVNDEGFYEWSSAYKPKDECTKLGLGVKEVNLQAPSAFKFSIQGFHYIIMAVVVAAVGGYFTYRFIRLVQSYKKIEKKFLEDGTIEITNL